MKGIVPFFSACKVFYRRREPDGDGLQPPSHQHHPKYDKSKISTKKQLEIGNLFFRTQIEYPNASTILPKLTTVSTIGMFLLFNFCLIIPFILFPLPIHRLASTVLKHSSRSGSCNREPKTPPTKTAATRKTTKLIVIADSKRRGSLGGSGFVAVYVLADTI